MLWGFCSFVYFVPAVSAGVRGSSWVPGDVDRLAVEPRRSQASPDFVEDPAGISTTMTRAAWRY
jgi:hypothetical protein